MNQINHKDIESIYFKVIYLGLFLNLFVPVVSVFLALFLRSKGVGEHPISSLNLLLFILLGISASEILAIYLFRQKLLKENTFIQGSIVQDEWKDNFFRSHIIIFSLALSPTLYGFVYFVLGGELSWFLVFVAMTLLCFRLFKPDLDETRERFNKINR
jgi:hypothetical protein